MKITARIYTIFLFSLFIFPVYAEKTGYFVVPVADLLLHPIKNRNIREAYDTLLSASPHTGQYACARGHQGLFNEQVTILQEFDDELQISLTNCFFETALALNKQSIYWALKDSIIIPTDDSLADLFPQPITYESPLSDDDCITLILPWQDDQTSRIYSVGTRFNHYDALDTCDSVGVIYYDHTIQGAKTGQIARDLCVCDISHMHMNERKELFVNILRLWASHSNECQDISYVWGGVSWATSSNHVFNLVKDTIFDTPVTYWIRPDTVAPLTGFDCSGLILRAAQIAGLPYYYKNTTTMLHYLRELSNNEQIEVGDIIWCPGHVMVVSNLEENLLVESRGYSCGDGKVLETTLHERFGSITTYEELAHVLLMNIPLLQKGSKTIKKHKILKLSSLWE